MARNNSALLYLLVGALIIFGAWCVLGRKRGSNESYADSKKVRDDPSQDIEYVQQADGDEGGEDGDFQLLGVADAQPAFEIGFGMGPGLYGSGRATSEMVGN